jgi:hypothetical protein
LNHLEKTFFIEQSTNTSGKNVSTFIMRQLENTALTMTMGQSYEENFVIETFFTLS